MLTLRQNGNLWEVVDGAGVVLASFDGDDARRTYALAVQWLADNGDIAPALPVDDLAGTAPEGCLAERWVAGPQGIVSAGPTGDGRDFTGCQFTWRDTVAPLPLMFLTETTYGHFEAQLAGFIEAQGDPLAGGAVQGWFHDSDTGRQARDVLRAQTFFAVSVDPGAVDATFVCTEEVSDDYGSMCVDGQINFQAYEIAGLTMVPFPGFGSAAITLDAAPAVEEPQPIEVMPVDGQVVASGRAPEVQAAIDAANAEHEAAVVAAADATVAPVVELHDRRRALAASAPSRPPAAWLTMTEPDDDDDPRYIDQRDGQRGIPMTITDEGQVYGHFGLWGTCHVGMLGECVTPPVSQVGYAQFMVGATVADDGNTYATGVLTAGCDHAAIHLRAAGARDHYAHNGVGWADVRCSNGRHGAWAAGTLRPDVTPEQVRVLRAGALSGDWRAIGAGLETIGILAVNVPGFPIIREALAASGLEVMPFSRLEYAMGEGRQQALVAAGIVTPTAEVMGALVASGTVEICSTCGQDGRRGRVVTANHGANDERLLTALREMGTDIRHLRSQLSVLEGRTRPALATAIDSQRARLRRSLSR